MHTRICLLEDLRLQRSVLSALSTGFTFSGVYSGRGSRSPAVEGD